MRFATVHLVTGTVDDARAGIHPAGLVARAALTVLLIAPASLTGQEIDPAATNLDGPEPRLVEPAGLVETAPPSDAIVLFGGTSTEEWEEADSGGPVRWRLSDGVLTVRPGAGDIRTKRVRGRPTVFRGMPQYDEAHGDAPLRLQSHPSGSEVSFRNIWIREL